MFDALIELMREDVPPIGCVVMSGNFTTLYNISGTDITQCFNIEINLPNKHGRGGQSQSRFERLAEEARHNYISKAIEAIIRIYDKELPLIMGGPAHLKKNKMVKRLSEITIAPKIIRVVDIQYDKKAGLYELLNKCSDVVTSIQIEKERKWITTFMTSLDSDDNLAVYGEKNITYCLNNGFLATFIVHEDVNIDDLHEKCDKYGTELVIITSFLPEAN